MVRATACASTAARANGISFVATLLTQSDEPANGTRVTSIPSSLNQPILVAIANGAAPPEIVRAQKPTRNLETWAVAVGNNVTRTKHVNNIRSVRFIRPPLLVQGVLSRMDPKRGCGGGSEECIGSTGVP